MKTCQQATAVTVACLLGATAMAREHTDAPARDAWLDGKLETVYLFNRHLDSFAIDTDARAGVAYFSGAVVSDRQVASNTADVKDVHNELTVQ